VSRATRGWLVRRQSRNAICTVKSELEYQPSPSGPLRRLARGLGSTLQGLVLLPPVAVLSLGDEGVGLVKSIQRVAYGTRSIAGLLGWNYEQCRQTHRV
jgi:hypothetical protein